MCKQAEALQREGERIARKVFGSQSLEIATHLNNLGVLCAEQVRACERKENKSGCNSVHVGEV